MRLLNIRTKCLEEVFDRDTPPYAILSHTWSANEITYKHAKADGSVPSSIKIDGSCEQAANDELDYVWM